MKVYLDLVLILNFAFDFLLLMTVSILLKRKASTTRLLLGAFIGSLSVLTLFIKITSLQLFLLKVFISIIMTLIAFGYQNIRYTSRNLFYLYTSSIILGGFLYFLNVQFSYKQEGIVFYHKGFSINAIVLIIFSPIILYTYIRQIKRLKNNYNDYYHVTIYIEDKKIECTAFLDTGNKLEDPYLHKPIIMLEKDKIHFHIKEENCLFVPYLTVNGSGILKCMKPKKIIIDGIGEKKKCLIGIMEEKIKIDGVSCILNTKLWEE